MDAKGHCKLRYGDGGDDEDADLEEFYDYSSRFCSVQFYVTKFVIFKRSMLIPVFLWVLIWELSNWPSLSTSLRE